MDVKARWNVPMVVGLGLAVAISTALQTLQSGPSQVAWRPYLLLGSAMAGVVAAWQLVAGALVVRTPSAGAGALGESDPRRIGRYRVQGLLGSGAMGRAYLARDSRGALVAIKTVRSEYADNPEFRRRFAREVEAIARVHSPYTTGLLDADVRAVVPWLVTPYVAGPSLQRAVEEHGAWAAPAVSELAAGVAAALAAIHAAGIVHRDLKPANILLAVDGPRVIDFGIARAADASQLTATMNRPGTPGFMAPEQALGSEVGPAADIFALGAVLAYVATGRAPFGTGSTDVIFFRIIHQEPDLAGIEPPLRSLIESCLDKRPQARPNAAAVLTRARAIQVPRPAMPGQTWLPAAVASEVGRLPVPAILTSPGRGRQWPIATVSAAALIVAVASAGIQFVPHQTGEDHPGNHPTTNLSTSAPSKVAVPTLVGLTNTQARDKLSQFKLQADARSVTCSDPNQQDRVLNQATTPDSLVNQGSTITYEWCSGPRTVVIPADVVNQSLSGATAELQALRLEVAVKPVDSGQPLNTVLAVSPAPGNTVAEGTTVTLTVSKADLVIVPDLTGRTVAEAQAVLNSLGFSNVVVVQQNSTTVSSGRVLATDPAAGTSAVQSARVTVFVATFQSPTSPSPSPTP
jgi:serine/threonine protein kinase